jgi:hypothetical protein
MQAEQSASVCSWLGTPGLHFTFIQCNKIDLYVLTTVKSKAVPLHAMVVLGGEDV